MATLEILQSGGNLIHKSQITLPLLILCFINAACRQPWVKRSVIQIILLALLLHHTFHLRSLIVIVIRECVGLGKDFSFLSETGEEGFI